MTNLIFDNAALLNNKGMTLDYFKQLMSRYPHIVFNNIDDSGKLQQHAVYVYYQNIRFIEIWEKRGYFHFVMKKTIMTEAEIEESKRDWKKDTAFRGRVKVDMFYLRELYQYIIPKIDMIDSTLSSIQKTKGATRGDITSVSLGESPADSTKAQLYGRVKEDTDTAVKIEAGLAKLDLHGEDREAVVKVRVNQSEFRDRLLKRYSKCCLCGVSDPSLLTASHIKPWSESEPNEKLDVDNGFLLCPNHDKLFDKGFISFTDEGKIMISSSLSDTDRMFTNVNPDLVIDLTEKNKEYLAFHRDRVFVK